MKQIRLMYRFTNGNCVTRWYEVESIEELDRLTQHLSPAGENRLELEYRAVGTEYESESREDEE